RARGPAMPGSPAAGVRRSLASAHPVLALNAVLHAKPRPHRGGIVQVEARRTRAAIPDQHADSLARIDLLEAAFVGEVVAGEHRRAAAVRWHFQQRGDRAPLVPAFLSIATGIQFHYLLALLEPVARELFERMRGEG